MLDISPTLTVSNGRGIRDKRERTWSEFNTQGLSRSQNRIADSDTRCLLVHLDRSFVGIDPNDLCSQLRFRSNIDRLQHTSD